MYEAFQQGLTDARATSELINSTAANEMIIKYNNAILEKKNEENIRLEKEFLDANAQKEGVIVTASGLQYEVINEGK